MHRVLQYQSIVYEELGEQPIFALLTLRNGSGSMQTEYRLEEASEREEFAWLLLGVAAELIGNAACISHLQQPDALYGDRRE